MKTKPKIKCISELELKEIETKYQKWDFDGLEYLIRKTRDALDEISAYVIEKQNDKDRELKEIRKLINKEKWAKKAH